MTSFLRRQSAALTVAVLAIAILPFLSARHLDNSIMMAIFALFALSAGMNFGQAGIPSVATAAFGAVAAYTTSIATTRWGLSPYLGLILAMLVPCILAYPLARAVSRLSPLPLSIATLVMSRALEVAIRGGDFLGGYVGISGVPAIPFFKSQVGMHILGWGLVTIVLLAYSNLMNSTLGRALNTTRYDTLRATADGVSVGRLLATFFTLSSVVAGIGGWLYAHQVSYIGPESLTSHVSITVLLMATVGGARFLIGPVIGAVLLLLISDYLPAAESQGMVYGAALVLVLLLAPQGLVGLAVRLLQPRSKNKSARAAFGQNPATADASGARGKS